MKILTDSQPRHFNNICTLKLDALLLKILIIGMLIFTITVWGHFTTQEVLSNSIYKLNFTINFINQSLIIYIPIVLFSSILYAICITMVYSSYKFDAYYSLPLLFLFGLIVFHGIGSNILFNINYISDWFNTNISITCFTIAVILIKYYISKNGRFGCHVISKNIGLYSADYSILFCLFILFLLLLYMYYFWTGGAPLFIALYKLFHGEPGLAKKIIHMARKAQYYDASNYIGQGYFELIRVGLLPYLTLLLYLRFHGGKTYQKIFAYVSIFVVILLSLASGQRWPTAFFILSFIYLLHLIHHFPIWNRKILTIIFLLLVSLFLLTYLMNRTSVQGEEGFSLILAIINRIFYRITLASHLPVYLAYFVFPEKMGFQMGTTWIQDFIAYLPGPDQTFGVEYSALLGQSWGSAPLTILGELYANLGPIGPACGSLLLGLLIALLNETYKRKMAEAGSYAIDYTIIGIGLIRLCYGSTIGFISNALLPILFFRILFSFTKMAR